MVEDVDGILVLRSHEEEYPSLAALSEVAHAARGGDGAVTVVVGRVDSAGDDASGHSGPLGELFDALRRKGTEKIQLVLSGAGAALSGQPCLAHRIADAWRMEVVAPDGAVLLVPGGALFVQDSAQRPGNWWSFTDGQTPRPLGPRTPPPVWQREVSRMPSHTASGCVLEQIPAGIHLRPAEAARPEQGDLPFAIPVDQERPLVLVGLVGSEEVAADEVAEVLAGLPPAERARARLAPGGRHDVLGLAQSIADRLDSEVEVLTGIPLMAGDPRAEDTVRMTVVGSDGEPSWQPYVTAVACRPTQGDVSTSGPRVVHRQPLDVVDSRWAVDATRAGLAVRERSGPPAPIAGLPVDPDMMTLEVGEHGRAMDESVLPVLSRILINLPPANRSRTTLLVSGTLTGGEKELRRLAARHGIASVRYRTPERPTSEPTPVRTSEPELVSTPVPMQSPISSVLEVPEAVAPEAAPVQEEGAIQEEVVGDALDHHDLPEACRPMETSVPALAAEPVALGVKQDEQEPRPTRPVSAEPAKPTAHEVALAVGKAKRGAGSGTPPVRRPRSDAPAPFTPGHVSTPHERAAFRALAADVWEAHGAVASRMLTRSPALRGQELDETRTDLVAVIAYLTHEEGHLSAAELTRDLEGGGGSLLSYGACLASGLRRLPSYRGIALRGGEPSAPDDIPATGAILRCPWPVSAWAKSPLVPSGAPVRYAVWSVTGRNVRHLTGAANGSGEAGEEIVFAPGSGFRVLGTREVHRSPVVLLRELPGSAASYAGDTGELGQLDRVALGHLERALQEGEFPAPGGPQWPERCVGRI
ncbi:hypothetical protein QFZ82_000426 [Streptomyces sp. V4I23]|uniref:hypothetical protein n=1 Tax=Streptomyces sp. V4I23 TaxID=3042282 RepID=UPI00278749C9|nr:hypothetical protein [Streptomyces sp. V4I23]MDQ1005941.1 hypothetical protein [Streptomyces sp. V4I23]